MDSTLKMFEDGEVFPDIVMVDSDNDSVSVSQVSNVSRGAGLLLFSRGFELNLPSKSAQH